MKPPPLPFPLLHPSSHRHYRHFATKYTAEITSTTKSPSSSKLTHTTKLLSPSPSPPSPLSPRGTPIPRHALICHITHLVKTPSSHPPLHSLTSYINTLPTPITLTPLEATLILKTLSPSPPLSLLFFSHLPSLFPPFTHTTSTFNRIILTLSHHPSHTFKVQKVKLLVGQMEREGIVGNISTVNILIGVFGGEGVGMCMELVKKWGLSMNGYTYKCVLQAYLRGYFVEKAYKVYGIMRRKGFNVDVVGVNMLLHGLAKNGMVDQAYVVFEDMKRRHCEPDAYTYTIMIRMTGKMGKPEESLALFQEMLSKGLTPNLIAYNTMLEALAKGRMVEKAIFLFSKMVENNCRPNEFSYSLLLTLLVAEGQLGKLDEIVELSKGYMTKSIYAYLVRTLSKLGHSGEAHRLFCNMWTFHDKGDRDACMSMLESLCKSGKTVEAIDLLDKIHEKGLSNDTMMYNTVLSALGRLKQISHLHDLYEKMRSNGPERDIYTYNILVSSFGRAGEVDEAVKIFDQLEESKYKPDVVSYNILINCLGKNGNLDEAHMRFKEMQEKGLSPDVVTYSTLIECFGKTDKVDMASRLFDDMVAQGCCPNIVTYNILLDCLERSGRTAEAVDMYAKLKEQGLTPDSITYSILERLQSGSRLSGRVRRKHPITGWVVSPLR